VNVLLLQLDGIMPNLALMRLAAHHRQQGDFVYLQQLRRLDGVGAIERGLFDRWDKVFASLIFTRSQPIARRLLEVYPGAEIGGTGWSFRTLEHVGLTTEGPLDYTDYPAFRQSMGFTQRGCRLNCAEFCVVPRKEGKAQSAATIAEIWRGEPWPRELILLDNDFFGPEHWRGRVREMIDGNFKVSLTQGINARMLSDEAAESLASLNYYNDAMDRRLIHTAWDSLGDEKPLFRGLKALVKYGVKPDHICVYMLIGLRSPILTDADFERHRKLRDFGCRPYPMPFQRTWELVRFQTWVVKRLDLKVTWEDFKAAGCRPENLGHEDADQGMLALMDGANG
jgi:hypothetical protein